MGDQNDGLALFAQYAQDTEEVVRLFGRQHARRLIEDQNVGAAIQRLEDFDALLLADRDVLDDGVRVDVKAVFVGQALQLLARLAQRGGKQRLSSTPRMTFSRMEKLSTSMKC